MLKNILSVFLFSIPFIISSQEIPSFGVNDNHSFYIKALTTSKDKNFEEIVAKYDDYINSHPNNIIAKIERCKFIGNSYWDAYEEYNLKEEETEECISSLYNNYSENPKVIIYRAENLYGKAKLEVLEKAEKLIRKDDTLWSASDLALIYKMLAENKEAKDYITLSYYLKAQKKDKSLDLSLPIAKIYKNQGKIDLATSTLTSSIEKDTLLWVMNNKANLFLELEEPEKALDIYDLIAIRDSTYINNGEMAKVMAGMNNYELSRNFLVKDTIPEWNKTIKIQNLFAHDLKYSDAETALITYRKLQETNSNDDFLGIKRLKVAFKSPFLFWNASEIFHFVLFILSLGLLLLVPYLWVLPVYSLGQYLKNKVIISKLNFNWNIKHFWIISFLWLLIQYLAIIIFEYQETINYYFDINTFYNEEEISDLYLTKTMIFFVVAMAFATLLILNKKNIKHITQTNQSIIKSVIMGFGFVMLNGIILKILGSFIDLSEEPSLGVLYNAKEEIIAILKTKGFGVAFVCAALIGPVYEEIIFRGVILGTVEKRIGFLTANIFQAILFAAIHFNLKLFIFYFIFGLIMGHLANKTKGLLVGIIYHCINNFIVVLVLYYTVKNYLI